MSTTQESTVQVSTTLGSTYCTATLVLAAPPPLLSHTSQPQDRVLICSGHKTTRPRKFFPTCPAWLPLIPMRPPGSGARTPKLLWRQWVAVLQAALLSDDEGSLRTALNGRQSPRNRSGSLSSSLDWDRDITPEEKNSHG